MSQRLAAIASRGTSNRQEEPMRRWTFVLVLASVSLVGCSSTRWNMFGGAGGRTDTGYLENPTREKLVYFINFNADRVQSVKCDHMYIQCSQGGPLRPSIGLDGTMACEKPRNFRLVAKLGLSGTQELDMGSNQEEFWYWIARGDPYQFHCPYRALEEGRVQRMPLPIQPDWIIEALGIAKCGPVESYSVVAKRDTVELVEKARSPQGRVVRKVTVFRRSRAANGSPQVMAHLLIDEATNKEICSATITQSQIVSDERGVQVVLPKKVAFWMPEGKIKLAMTLDEVKVNTSVPRPDLVFTRRPMPNIRSYDLAQGRFDSSIQRVEGRMQ
jgi:hypothetical protein